MTPPPSLSRDPGPIRVALLHDSRVVHAGLRHLTGPYSDRVLVLPHTGASVQDAHVVLHGDHRPAQFARTTPASLELVYGFRPRPEVVRAAVQRGATGYACKNWTARQLVSALEQVVGGWHVGGRVAAPSSTSPEPAATPDDVAEAGLSPREVELLRLVAQGLSNQDIAAEMTVSVNSVKSYIRSAYRKIGVTRRTQAVLWTLGHDLDRAPKRVTSR